MTRFHYNLRRFCTFLIGLVLFFAGSLKLMDPVGTGLIVTEYLRFLHLGFLQPAAPAIGITLSLAEALTGTALLTGTFRKAAALLASLLILLFTGLTLAVLLRNPDMDCGCFGEAIHLTHLQSFLKNAVLLLLALCAFVPFKAFGRPRPRKYIAFGLIAAGLIGGLVRSALKLPAIDFTPFAPSAELYASQDNPTQADDGLLPAYIYEKDGKRGAFALHTLPDSTWTFVGIDTLQRSNYIPPTHIPILAFTDADGEYQDERATLGKVIALSVYEPAALDPEQWHDLGEFGKMAARSGMTPLYLVAASPEQTVLWNIPQSVRNAMYQADPRTLVSLNRSNGGATYIDDGVIVRKWARGFLPEEKDIRWLVESADPTDETVSTVTRGRLRYQGFLLYSFALMLLL